MSERDDIERLRQSFQGLAEAAAGECSADDLAAVWSAVHGELPPEARRALVARLADEPALAEAWRLAHALKSPEAAGDVVPVATHRSWPAPWLAAAAVAVLGLAAVLLGPRLREREPVLRQAPGVYAVESLLTPDVAVPRAAFDLRWTPGPPGSRYGVRVTTEDLRVLATAADLDAPTYRVPAASLEPVPVNGLVFWQVDVSLPANGRLSSRTFVTRVQ